MRRRRNEPGRLSARKVTRALKPGDTYSYKSHSVSTGIGGSQTVDDTYTNRIGTATYNGESVLARSLGADGNTDYLRQDA